MGSKVSFDGKSILYKGLDIGITAEMIQDLKAHGVDLNENIMESLYNKHISILRNKKIEEILN